MITRPHPAGSRPDRKKSEIRFVLRRNRKRQILKEIRAECSSGTRREQNTCRPLTWGFLFSGVSIHRLCHKTAGQRAFTCVVYCVLQVKFQQGGTR